VVPINQKLVMQANLFCEGVWRSGSGWEASLEPMLEHVMPEKTIMVNIAWRADALHDHAQQQFQQLFQRHDRE
jgi:hypothetical protein